MTEQGPITFERDGTKVTLKAYRVNLTQPIQWHSYEDAATDDDLRAAGYVKATAPDAGDVEDDLIPRMVVVFSKAAGPAWEADESGMEAGMRAVLGLLAARESVLRALGGKDGAE